MRTTEDEKEVQQHLGSLTSSVGHSCHEERTGLTSFGDQARAKVRAKRARLTFVWSSADLRLIS
jgi:hypothetical protein